MTTLIIHPQNKISRAQAYKLASKYLHIDVEDDTTHPDLHILDGLDESSIGIDEVRKLASQLQYQPYSAPMQVGLILSAEKLTQEAQNSLLKDLEEPTPQTVFILTTSHEKHLLPTILSRSRKIFVNKNLDEKKSEEEIIPDDLKKYKCFKKRFDPEIFLKNNTVDKFLIIEEIVKQNKDNPRLIDVFLNGLLDYHRVKLLEKIKDSDLEKLEIILHNIKKITRAMHYISRNSNKRLSLENLILQLNQSIIEY